MNVISDFVQCHAIQRCATAPHYANMSTTLYLNDVNWFQSVFLYRCQRKICWWLGVLVAQAAFNIVCVLGTEITD